MEEFTDVIGYENLYKVNRNGIVINRQGKQLKYYINHGYLIVVLYKNRKPKRFNVHRIVYSSFNNMPLNSYGNLQIDHINTKRDDNRLENLRLVTPKENRANPLTKIKFIGKNNPFYGKKHSDSTIKHFSDVHKIPINQYDLNNNFIKNGIQRLTPQIFIIKQHLVFVAL